MASHDVASHDFSHVAHLPQAGGTKFWPKANMLARVRSQLDYDAAQSVLQTG